MVINNLEKIFVTHDAVTMLKEMDIIHPAAKIVVMAAQSQETEVGDGTNFVVTFAGELLHQAEQLLTTVRLHPSDIITGYKKALKKTMDVIEECVVSSVSDVKDIEQVSKGLKSGISATQYGQEDVLIPLIAQACINVVPLDAKKFNVDNVRSVKVTGGSISDSFVIKGFVLERDTEGSIKHIKDAKIAAFACNIDLGSLDSKETISIKTAEELLSYSNREEKAIEDDIKDIASAGINVIVTQGSFGEMALHFLERHNIMAIKVQSKFDMRRLCNSCGATPLVRLGKPTKEEIGTCSNVDVKELSSKKLLVFDQGKEKSKVSTIVLRGATNNILDEVERAIDDGVNIYKAFTKDPRLIAGGGAFEMELFRKVLKYSQETPGLDQYAIKKFAESFQIIPKTLAESSGLNSSEVISNLSSQHENGNVHFGVDLNSTEGVDVVKELQLYDSFMSKFWAIQLATNAVITILSVDQIIMSRPSGGPKPRGGSMDPED
jgi:T-complex protein 1 subunit theta